MSNFIIDRSCYGCLFSILGIITMKRGMHNIKKCDDELFTKIDQYKNVGVKITIII